MGERLERDRPAVFEVRVPAMPQAGIALIADGEILALGRGSLTMQRIVSAHAYRVEIYARGMRVPWMVTNPIFAGAPPAAPVAAPQASPPGPEWTRLDPAGFTIERDASSNAAIASSGDATTLSVSLGPGEPAGQYGAAVLPLPSSSAVEAVAFTASASRPMRLSVQVRLPASAGGLRWRKSVYLDATPRTVSFALSEFTPIAHAGPLGSPAPAGRLESLLFVIDTLNTATGTRLTVTVADVRAR
jgi:hypothetical protein